MRTLIAVLLAACCTCLLAAPVEAQVVWSPRKFTFTPSPDHATNVSKYQLQFYTCTVNPDGTIASVASDPTQTSDVPLSILTPVGSDYEAQLSAIVPLFSYPAGVYHVARMVAVGNDPTKLSPASGNSNPFAEGVSPGAPINLRFAR